MNRKTLSTLHSPLSTSPRRGLLLILVLAVLAMFSLIAVAFVVLTAHHRRITEGQKRIEAITDPPQELLRQAAMQVAHGPTTNAAGYPDPASRIGVHSLFEDIYGNEYATGTISGTSSSGFAQIVNLNINSLSDNTGAGYNVGAELARRVGCVLTITGPNSATNCYGLSTRIVAIDASSATATSATIQVLAFSNGLLPPANATFTINGVPFSGTGFGYESNTDHDLDLTWDTSASQLSSDAPDSTHWPVALLPNMPLSVYRDNNTSNFTFGGANEDYDAADFQNVALAAQVPTSATFVSTLPSFHRPALVRYWMNKMSETDWETFATNNPDLARSISLRPLKLDHPNFTGSNPRYNAAWDMTFIDNNSDGVCDYSWDVDNDGDGMADSVWIDAGLPVRQTSDGRLYKPLIAVLCVDLDGRLNLNAHGSLAQTDTTNYGSVVLPKGGAFAGGTLATRGAGFGPAEINLNYLYSNTYANQLMTGYNGYQGRYGTDGAVGSHLPGSSNIDTLNANNWFEYSNQNYWDFTAANNAGSYGTPPDPFGVGVVGLDQAGRPLFVGMTDSMSQTTNGYLGYGSMVANSPYELNLDANQYSGLPSASATIDNPFSPAELERILRPFDIDSPDLPDRLAQLTLDTTATPPQSVLYNPYLRHAVTTISSDVPTPGLAVFGSNRIKHISDLLDDRGVPQTAWAELLPPDLLAGLRMDINRPFGDGLDNDGDGIVDEFGETDNFLGLGLTFSYDGSNTLATDSLAARQLMARYLYVLACLTADKTEILNRLGGSATYADVARFLAQWAVNAVDFKDRDSIMTRFDYDPKYADPGSDLSLAGWTATTDGTCTVWGCERPELLISDTLALHDRRTKDTETEQVDTTEADECVAGTPTKTTATAPDKPDASFDQIFKPKGSMFVELYNPWSDKEPRSNDLYSAPDGGVELNKLTPASAGDQYPVWRLITVDKTDADKDPDDPEGIADATKLPTIERAVYFVRASGSVVLPSDGDVKFYPNANHATKIAPILPGRYALIGPGESGDAGASTTYLGFETDKTPGTMISDQQRRIVLTPGATATSNQVEVYNDGTNDDLDLVSKQYMTAIVISEPQRLNISEPDNGYIDESPDTTPYSPTTGYVPAWDIPLDISEAPSAEMKAAVMNNGRTDRVKILHLQRLANPLKPYNNIPTSADYNPYRTIDSMALDLTAFNGIDSSTDPKLESTSNENEFWARQRGQNNDSGSAMNLWKQEPVDANNHPKPNSNLPFPTAASLASFTLTWPLHHSFGILNDPYVDNSSTDVNNPASPFPWLTWNNRPYVSPYELMQVSWLRSSQLLDNYRLAQAGDNPYTSPSQPFAHLTNFFLSGLLSGSSDEELHRVFEFLRVPSPFVGADVQADPTAAVSGTHNFHPPFNHISNYREPGKLNINTIYNSSVYYGLINDSSPDVSWSDFLESRRGYGSTTSVLETDSSYQYPTYFGKPFRSFGGAKLTPTLESPDPLKYDREIDATLLRHGDSTDEPLFQHDSTNDVDNANRNPYFRYQGIQRLNNLVTTRSNVYAVWITVGYFEVTPNTTNYDIYPDGYELGRELGVDTGEIERHKAFFIFDRSIPVGFQRGKDLNVDKAILVERYIE